MDPATLRNGLIVFLFLAGSLCLRAYAQAWVATKLGDRTPANEGRLTANPLPHVDILGTVVLPLIFIFYLQPPLNRYDLTMFLGWAKPVPIEPRNFKNPHRGAVLTQFAGFAMSFLILLACAVVGGLLMRSRPDLAPLFFGLMSVNAMFMVFDWLPIPPLPAGVLLRHLGWVSEERYMHIARWSGLVLIILINLRPFVILFNIAKAIILSPFLVLMELLAR